MGYKRRIYKIRTEWCVELMVQKNNLMDLIAQTKKY